MAARIQHSGPSDESEIENYEIWVSTDPAIPPIIPDLAAEIGLNESIVLLQLYYWLQQSNIVRDGRRWTCQSVQDMQRKAFKWWSLGTINRTIASLVKHQLILSTDQYNQDPDDQTLWFALNPEGFEKLQSVKLKSSC